MWELPLGHLVPNAGINNMKTKKMCRIKQFHDFPDYPCKICSPKNWWIKKIIDETTSWLMVIGVGLLLAYCFITLL